MSIYKHFPNKDAILEGISEAVLAEVEVPAAGPDPVGALREAARSYRQTARRHPRVFPLIATRPVGGAAGMRVVDAVAALLLASGLTATAAISLYRVLDSYITGFALMDIARTRRCGAAPDIGGFTALAALVRAAPAVDLDGAFDEGLDLLLARVRRDPLLGADHPASDDTAPGRPAE
jgi:AcrR family transcriptional regulator